ncbi:hypothetical protein FHG87_014557 [Trinorchestia longiramus]|nr:hypothetical protein FHG87_014557 [Trinorchestia longiramus]
MALEPKSVKNPHSVPVPRLYKFCSKVLVEYFQFKGKIPKLILQLARKEPGSMIKLANKLLLALEAKLNIVKAAVENIGVLEKNPGLRYELALVIAADMLLNEVQSKRFERLCKPVLTMLEVREQLQQEYQRCLQDAPAAEDRCKPRWVCVNTLLMSTTEAKQRLTEAGFSLKHYTPRSYEQFLLSVRVSLEGL